MRLSRERQTTTGATAMNQTMTYVTRSGANTFTFCFTQSSGGWQTLIMGGPSFPSALVPRNEEPPGCKWDGTHYAIRWFDLAQVNSLQSAQALAAHWAEDIEIFLSTHLWNLSYTTNDGTGQYSFSIERTNGLHKVYIESQPSYQNRATDAHSTHRLSDGQRKYICWSTPIETWKMAEDVCALWAERTHRYIRTGKKLEAN